MERNRPDTVDIVNGDTGTSEGITGIYRVPHFLRRLNEEAYTPQVISIGPFHSENRRWQTMQDLKVKYSSRFLGRAGIDFNALVTKINAQMMGRIRQFYREIITLSDDQLSELVLRDASFILELFLKSHSSRWQSEDPLSSEFLLKVVTNDLLLLENQLPFWFLKEVFELAPPKVPGVSSVLQLTFEFFKDFNNDESLVHESFGGKIQHFTDLLRTFLLPESRWPSAPQDEPHQRGDKKVKLLYSATQLQEAGVKFKMGSNKCLTDLKFENGVLEIPQLEFYDTTEALIRNVMALEQTCYISNGFVTDYFVMLDFLTNATKDMELLCASEIVDNYLGDTNAATLIVNSLHKNILWKGLSKEYCGLCERLNEFYKDPRHMWKAILKRDYFSTPWRTASTVAVAILFVLTFIQTVCSILQVL